jgi:hypothetical protein
MPAAQKLCRCKHCVFKNRIRVYSHTSLHIINACCYSWSNVYPDKEVPNKNNTSTGNNILRHWKRLSDKRSLSNETAEIMATRFQTLHHSQQCNTAKKNSVSRIGALCMKGFMCGSQGFLLNVTPHVYNTNPFCWTRRLRENGTCELCQKGPHLFNHLDTSITLDN